jgi:hypothetical protein
MTPSEIETSARRRMNAVGSKFWSSEEIIEDYLYHAALEMAQETFCIENRYTQTTVANQAEYAAPSLMLAIKRITYDTARKLRPITKLQLDSIDFNTNTTVTGTPQYYWYDDETIGLYPAPDDTKELKIYTYDQPAVTTASTTLQIPTRFHGFLVIGVIWYMSMKELGHPNTRMFEFQWNGAGNPNSCINKVRKSVRMVNKDQFATVILEENQPSTVLGMV